VVTTPWQLLPQDAGGARIPPVESLQTQPLQPDDDLLACDACGRSPDDGGVWRVNWDVDAAGRDTLVALCPDCARAELDD
jgi:hypothetical protein